MATSTTSLVLLALVWGAVASAGLDSVDGKSEAYNSTDKSADFFRGVAPRADYECPAVCPACPALPGCPACPAAPPCPSAPPCPRPRRIPPGYHYYEGLGYYKMHYRLRTWPEAELMCASEGGYLVVINSVKEADLIESLLTKHGFTRWVHIGVYNADKKGRYFTVLGEPLASTGYAVWAPGQPSGVTQEHCASFDAGVGICDTYCDYEYRFLCELD